MGQLVSGPVTRKDSGDGEARELGLAWGYSGMQGWRDSMEDAHLALPSLEAVAPTLSSAAAWRGTALFGVMDGHGGEHVAHFCERYLPGEVARGPWEDPCGSLVSAFHRMDEMLADPANLEELQSLSNDMSPVSLKSWTAHPNSMGCTAVVCCVRSDSIIVANAGDSRAVLARRGQAMEMSEDHKPNLPGESARIKKAGGLIFEQHVAGMTHYRVNGNLNLSRSIGDLGYKQNNSLSPKEQMICSTPDVRTFRRQTGDEFMVLACDGVWDVLSSQEVVDFIRLRLGNLSTVRDRLQNGTLRLSTIVEDLLDHCLSPDLAQTYGLGGDNMTAVLVVFLDSAKRGQDTWLDVAGRTLGGPSWLCAYG